MKKILNYLVFLSLLFLLSALCFGAEKKKHSEPSDILIVSGTINNVQGKAVKEAALVIISMDKKLN